MATGTLQLTTDQLGRLLHKAAHEPRRNAKRFLKDLGGEGSAAELDAWLATAQAHAGARGVAVQLETERAATARNIELGMEGRVAEMLAHVLIQMRVQGLTQQDVAERCGWAQPQVAAYLNGRKDPGARNLAKLASAVGHMWRLTPLPSAE